MNKLMTEMNKRKDMFQTKAVNLPSKTPPLIHDF
jgi:hypothetical protein